MVLVGLGGVFGMLVLFCLLGIVWRSCWSALNCGECVFVMAGWMFLVANMWARCVRVLVRSESGVENDPLSSDSHNEPKTLFNFFDTLILCFGGEVGIFGCT